jgi:hypothetical protein
MKLPCLLPLLLVVATSTAAAPPDRTTAQTQLQPLERIGIRPGNDGAQLEMTEWRTQRHLQLSSPTISPPEGPTAATEVSDSDFRWADANCPSVHCFRCLPRGPSQQEDC